jgi:hypothetical protein
MSFANPMCKFPTTGRVLVDGGTARGGGGSAR